VRRWTRSTDDLLIDVHVRGGGAKRMLYGASTWARGDHHDRCTRTLQMSHMVTEHGGSLKRALVEQPLGLMRVSEQGGGQDALSWRPHDDDGMPSGIGAIGLRAREGMAQRLGGACAAGGDQQ
jgi:hypothetical protein